MVARTMRRSQCGMSPESRLTENLFGHSQSFSATRHRHPIKPSILRTALGARQFRYRVDGPSSLSRGQRRRSFGLNPCSCDCPKVLYPERPPKEIVMFRLVLHANPGRRLVSRQVYGVEMDAHGKNTSHCRRILSPISCCRSRRRHPVAPLTLSYQYRWQQGDCRC